MIEEKNTNSNCIYVVCGSDTDPACDYKYGYIYFVEDGKLRDAKRKVYCAGLSSPLSIEELEKMTGVRWYVITKIHDGSTPLFWSGYVLCTHSIDPTGLKEGEMYAVHNGILNTRDYLVTSTGHTANEVIKDLKKATGTEFIPVLNLW